MPEHRTFVSRITGVLGALRPTPSLSIASLGYHEVTDDPSQSGFQRPAARPYKHTCAAFREHIEAIGGGSLVPTLVTEVDYTRGGRHLALTFDDGGKSARYISDALGESGWRAHFLIPTALIGARTFLGHDDIRAIRRDGHIVGSHSHTHPDIFNILSRNAMNEEWRTSCGILSQLLGEACVVASVPGGDISDSVLAAANDNGIRFLFTSEPWLVPRKVGRCWVLGRVCIKSCMSAARVQDLSAHRGWGTALFARRCSVAMRNAVHPLYRAYVRNRTREALGEMAR